MQEIRLQPFPIRTLFVVALTSASLYWTSCSSSKDAAAPSNNNRQRAILDKPFKTVINSSHRADRVILKFQEGTRVRKRNGQLVALSDSRSENEKQRMARANLTEALLEKQLQMLNQLLDSQPGLRCEPLFMEPEDVLDAERIENDRRSGHEHADLNLAYAITLDSPNKTIAEKLINRLNQLDIVEVAYPEPLQIAPPQVEQPPTPSDEHAAKDI